MRNNFKIAVLVFVTVVCYKCDAEPRGSDGLFFEDPREPATFKFGPDRGVVTYTFPKDARPKVQEDNITVQFMTVKPDAVLLRIVSEISNDYIEIYTLGGNVFTAYNLGVNNHLLAVISKKVNDNAYHVVKFLRQGHNASLQLDNNPTQYRYFSAHPQTFNSQSQIQIGGKLHKYGRLERPFTGIMTNVIVNNLRILDLAAEEVNHTSIWGDVQLVVSKPRDPQRLQRENPVTYPNDDLVVSGSGERCSGDDEDECSSSAVTDDDLIIPTYVTSTSPPFTTKSSRIKVEPCDDEDCFVGSGSGDGPGSGEYELIKTTTNVASTSPLFTTQSPRITVEPCDDEDCFAGSGSGDHPGSEEYDLVKTTTSAVTEISELPVTRRTWPVIKKLKPTRISTTTIGTTTITESSLTAATAEVTNPDVIETGFTEQLYTTQTQTTEEPSSYPPYPSTGPPEPAEPFVTLETILLISGISVVTLLIVVAIIVINRLKSKKDEKATV